MDMGVGRKPRVRWLAAALVSACALLGLAPISHAQDQVILAAAATFIPPVIATDAGQGLDFQNSDVLPHDVVSDAVDDQGNAAFRSPVIHGGARADVAGVEKLAAGA